MKFIGDEQTNLDQEKDWTKKNIIVTTKVNDSQKDPKDVGNDKNRNTICFVLVYVILY